MKRALCFVWILLFIAPASSGQKWKLEGVKMDLENPDPNFVKDLEKLRTDIDAAAGDPKLANTAKLHYYRGWTYLEIVFANNEVTKSTPEALEIATESFFKAIEFDKKNEYAPDSKFKLLNCAIHYYNRGVNSFNDADYGKALQYYGIVLKIIPLDETEELKRKGITEELITKYSYYGAMTMGDNKSAKALIQKLIDKNYQEPKIYADMARIYLEEKDTLKGLKVIEKGRERFENNKDLILAELDIYLKQGRTDILIQKLNNAIKNDSLNKVFYFVRGVSYEGMGQSDRAEKDYMKALEIDPGYYDAHYNLGVLYVNRANPLITKLEKIYKKEDYDKVEKQIFSFYRIAIPRFEKALELIRDDKNELKQVAEILKKLYGKIGENAKAQEMTDLLEFLNR